MIKPAICYKDMLEKALSEYFYTDEMMYYVGDKDSYLLAIEDSGSNGKYQYAILDKDKVVGYIAYMVDFYAGCVYNFGLFGFDKGNTAIGAGLKEIINYLVNMNFRRIEFRCIGGNPVKRHYDAYMNYMDKHGYITFCHTLHGVMRDAKGIYHDEYIYEFIKR
nr:hypothetical protein [uncultured Clostridium sp.]